MRQVYSLPIILLEHFMCVTIFRATSLRWFAVCAIDGLSHQVDIIYNWNILLDRRAVYSEVNFTTIVFTFNYA